MTLVGDPAQTAEAAGVGSWSDILEPYVEDRWEHTRLGVNYRTPAEIMDLAAAVVRAENPDFEPPSSVRSTGVRPWVRATDDLPGAVAKAVEELTPRRAGSRSSPRASCTAGSRHSWTGSRRAPSPTSHGPSYSSNRVSPRASSSTRCWWSNRGCTARATCTWR